MVVEIRIAQNEDAEEWNAINSDSPHGTLFHSWNWLKIAEKHTGMKLYPIFGMKNGEPLGIFPLFFQKRGPVRMVFSPPPHAALFYLGPVLSGCNSLKQEKRENIYNEFQNSVENFITHELKANYVSISLPPDLQDPRPFIWSGYRIEPRFDYVTNLSIGPDFLLQTLDKKQRQNLNRARKRGITVDIGGKPEYEAILDLMDIRYAQQGKILTASRHYFLDIFDEYKDNLRIFVARVDGEILSGTIDFQYRDGYYSWIGSPRPKKLISPSPNDLLLWESVQYASEQGCRNYITINAAGNKRLHSYYAAKFNPELKVHYHATKKTWLAGLFENGYVHFIKPLRGTLKSHNAKK